MTYRFMIKLRISNAVEELISVNRNVNCVISCTVIDYVHLYGLNLIDIDSHTVTAQNCTKMQFYVDMTV